MNTKKLVLLLSVMSGYAAHAQWSLTGNAGTNANIHFVGTLDKESLVFRVNKVEQMRVNQFGRITFQAQNSTGEVWNRNLLLGGGASPFTGFGNSVFGLGAFTLNAAGQGTTAIGNNAMAALSTGDWNTSLGANSMRLANGGSYNTSIGMGALEGPGSMEGNTAVGQAAMERGGASSSDYIAYNTAVGNGALPMLINGSNNAAFGYIALRNLKEGQNNIAIGTNAGANVMDGENSIFIGAETSAFTSSAKDELNIGNWIFGVNGTIGIGTFTNPLPYDGVAPDGERYKLFVKDGIRTEKVKVDVAFDNGWADYVFDKNYKLLPLQDLESFITKNGHLPEVPTTEEAMKEGVELKAMNILLLKKIEELTLYSIEQQKRSTEQQKRIEALEKQMTSQQ